MSGMTCPQEAAVLRAVRTGEWPEALAIHAAGCAPCRGIVQAAQWMQSLVQSSEKNLVLPDAKLVWWRAQLADRRAKAEGTQSVVEWLAFVSGAIAPLGLAGWVAWNWFGIQWQAARLLAGWSPQWAAAAYWFTSLAPALLFLAALSLAYPLLVRE